MAYDYELNIKPKMTKEDSDKMMKRFLEKGGKVEKCQPGYPLNVGSLDKSGKPSWTRQEVKEGKAQGNTPMPDLSTYKPGSYHDHPPSGNNPPRWEYQPPNKMAGK
jgi:hypothetical protein